MGWRPWVWRGRNPRGEGGGGSLRGPEHREAGSVWGGAQGLLAWALGEALFSTQMINTQVSALYFAGKLYLCFLYFSEITGISSVQFSCSVVYNSLQPHGLQQARIPYPSPTPRVYSNSCPYELTMPPKHLILCRPFRLPLSIFPSIRVFSNESNLCISGQSIGLSASASVLPMNIQDWFPLGLTGWISLLSKGLSKFSNITVQKHQFFSA